MTRKTLPKKLSDCLELALKDLAQVERMKRTYKVNMAVYHAPNGKCSVCLAGAVMARTLATEPTHNVGPFDFSVDEMRRLRAIDRLRQGAIDRAFYVFEAPRPASLPLMIPVTPYDIDPRAFKRDMRGLAKLLRSVGQ